MDDTTLRPWVREDQVVDKSGTVYDLHAAVKLIPWMMARQYPVPTLIPTLYPSGWKRSSNNFLPSSTMAQSAVFSSAVTEEIVGDVTIQDD